VVRSFSIKKRNYSSRRYGHQTKQLEDMWMGDTESGCFVANVVLRLQYQYIVTHKKQNKTYKLGETCLENCAHLTPEGIRDIKKGFCTIHLEIIINEQEMMEFCL
jgi:hypothetical protein